MTTPTETAILAVVAALQAASQSTGAVLPEPLRNEDLASRLTDVGLNLAAHLNVLDGEREPPDEMLGADLGDAERYDIIQLVEVEWAVMDGNSADRERHFDLGRKAIWDALKPDMSSGSPVYLGGAASAVRLRELISHNSTNAAGVANVKACVFVFEVLFPSTDPF